MTDIGKILPATAPDAGAKLRKTAEDFTANALGEMLAPMFSTLDESGGTFGGGPGESAWRPMMVQEFAKSMAHHGGMGLTASVTEALLRLQEKKP
jgi:peptidoglycan hydrolase FlgJ